MSLSGLQLPEAVIANLYRQVLVSSGQTSPASQSSPAAVPAARQEATATEGAYTWLGNNERHITLIVNFPGDAFLPDHHLQFLTRMLDACKLNLGDVAIVNHAVLPVNMDKLREVLHPQIVLLFGIEPVATGLPLNFPPFKDQAFAGCTYLFTPSLSELNQDNEEGKLMKSKLWVCLKKLFKL
jgi:hypothetical protein